MSEKEKRKNNQRPEMGRVKRVHFIGIGGCGMSAIAKILIKKGYTVTGSDLKESMNTIRLKDMGAKIFIGHQAANVRGSDLTVISSAIPSGNPEIEESISTGIPTIKRADMLGWIMDQYKKRIAVAGTHGKTTTTSMLANMLTSCDKDPTFLIGGEANDVDGNARMGKSEYVVAEADESDGSFLTLNPNIAVITNIESDHMEHYGTFEKVIETFIDFSRIVPTDGIIFLGGNGKGSEQLKAALSDRRIITYGLTNKRDYWADNIKFSERRSRFDVYEHENKLAEVSLSVPGMQNVENALAAIAVGRYLGCDITGIGNGLQYFTGAKRRFQVIGQVKDILVIDDYGHHPTEVMKTLEAAKLGFPDKRIICIFQPHRYTRTQYFYEEFGKAFGNADVVILTEIYSAGEPPIEGISGKTVFDEVRKHNSDVTYIPKKEMIPKHIIEIAKPGDIVITMGAGDITNLGKEILNRLKENG